VFIHSSSALQTDRR